MSKNRDFQIIKRALYEVISLDGQDNNPDKKEVLTLIKESKKFEDISKCFNQKDVITNEINFVKERNDIIFKETKDTHFVDAKNFANRRDKYLMEGPEDPSKITAQHPAVDTFGEEETRQDPEKERRKIYKQAAVGAGVSALGLALVNKSTRGPIKDFVKKTMSKIGSALKNGVPWGKIGDTLISPEFWKVSANLLLIFGGITAVSIAAWQVYDRYLSANGKACKNFKGREKTLCILKYKINAAEAALSKWKEALNACNHSTNRYECELGVHRHIYYWDKKVTKYRFQIERNTALLHKG